MLRLLTGNENDNTLDNGFGSGASMSLDSCTFTDTFTGNDNDLEERAQLYGNYRGSRHQIVSEKDGVMILCKVQGGETIEVSSCNVSDVSTNPVSKEKICPGDNQCRRDGLKQGPHCSPIRPGEGRLKYPAPL